MYDTAIIELYKEDYELKKDVIEFLEIDDKNNVDNYNKVFIGNTIYLIHYLNGEKVLASYGIVKEEKEETEKGKKEIKEKKAIEIIKEKKEIEENEIINEKKRNKRKGKRK